MITKIEHGYAGIPGSMEPSYHFNGLDVPTTGMRRAIAAVTKQRGWYGWPSSLESAKKALAIYLSQGEVIEADTRGFKHELSLLKGDVLLEKRYKRMPKRVGGPLGILP